MLLIADSTGAHITDTKRVSFQKLNQQQAMLLQEAGRQADDLLAALKQTLGCDLDPETNRIVRAAITKAESK